MSAGEFPAPGEVGEQFLRLARFPKNIGSLANPSGQGAAIGLVADTQRGEVQLNGKGDWQLQGDGTLNIDGTLAAGNREAVLAPLLTLLNARRVGNAYDFSVHTRIPSPLPRW